METKTIRIPPEMGYKLGVLARKRGEFITAAAQRAVADYLEAAERQEKREEKEAENMK